ARAFSSSTQLLSAPLSSDVIQKWAPQLELINVRTGQSMVGGAIPELMVLDDIRKQAEKAIGSKPVSASCVSPTECPHTPDSITIVIIITIIITIIIITNIIIIMFSLSSFSFL
ncbi:hypothetical protein STEG23_006263, partial [Scotinomys teguina]